MFRLVEKYASQKRFAIAFCIRNTRFTFKALEWFLEKQKNNRILMLIEVLTLKATSILFSKLLVHYIEKNLPIIKV
jgi:hypothetical protein